MNEQIKQQIFDEIRAADRIVLTRHKRPDGDALGSTLGFAAVLRAAFPEKDVRVLNADASEELAFLGKDDEPLTEEDYAGVLLLVLDTGSTDRISNPCYTKAKKIIRIDHHIDDSPYGDLSWVEDFRSATSEMIVDFILTFGNTLKLDRTSATLLYAGIVTDSGRFRYRETTPQTLRCAAELLSYGIDTESLYAHLYLEDISALRFRAWICKKMKKSEHGVLSLSITNADRRRLGLSQEAAGNAVNALSGVRGSLLWLVFIENDDGTTRVRLRSRFVACQPLAVRYHGGGHACASGATVYSKKEKRALLADADALVAEYKATHDGWL